MSVDLSPVERRAYDIAEEAGYWVIIRRSSRHSIGCVHVPDPEHSSFGDSDDPMPMCGQQTLGVAAEESMLSKSVAIIPPGHYPVCGHCTNRLEKQDRGEHDG